MWTNYKDEPFTKECIAGFQSSVMHALSDKIIELGVLKQSLEEGYLDVATEHLSIALKELKTMYEELDKIFWELKECTNKNEKNFRIIKAEDV